MAGLTENNDFLNEAKPSLPSTQNNVETEKKKRRTSLEVEMDKYPEYYALSEYQRMCLVATNYWKVMYGEPIIEVPPSDKNYEKYFDDGCYKRAKAYQKQKQLDIEFTEMLDKFKVNPVIEETELINNDNNGNNDKPSGDTVIAVEVAEVKNVIEVKEAEIIKPKVIEKVVEKVESNIKVKKPNKKSSDEQASLF